jgi:hypothetical protein
MANSTAICFARLGNRKMVSGMAAVASILCNGMTGKTTRNLLSRFLYLTALFTQVNAVGMRMAALSTGAVSLELFRMTLTTNAV